MIAQVGTRRLPRPTPPTVPDGWTQHEGGVWSWVSSGRTVTAAVCVYADGSCSAPAVAGVGKARLVTTEIERACRAVEALCAYVRAASVWERYHA